MFVHRGGGVSENGVAGQSWPVERGNEWKWCLTVGFIYYPLGSIWGIYLDHCLLYFSGPC